MTKMLTTGIVLASVLAGFVLAEPSTQPAGNEVVTASGLKIIAVSEGTDTVAQAGDTVWVHYRGTLPDGKEFDSSYSRGEPIEFKLGAGRVIKGWDEGISGMRIGDKRKLIIPPQLGYGERGAGDVIPPNATLHFDVELVGIRRP